MTRAIKIENLTKIDATSAQICASFLCTSAPMKPPLLYKTIAKSLNMDRDTVRKAVNRMIEIKS
ncbi:MAG: hypothetical protein ACLS4Z_11535 [Christensenellaceae bacterium]